MADAKDFEDVLQKKNVILINSREAIAAIFGDIVVFLRLEEEYWDSIGYYDSKRSIEILQVFFSESKFVHDLNFDFFLFELLPPFLIVDFCFPTLDFNNSLVCNI